MLTYVALGLKAYPLVMTVQLLLVSGTYLLAKLGTEEIPVIPFAILRFILSSILLFAFCFATRRFKRIDRRDYLSLVLLSLLLIPFNQGLFLFGQNLARSTHGALIFSLAPIFVAVFAGIFLSEKVPLLRWTGISLGVGGALIVICGQGIEWHSSSFRGDILIAFAMTSWALFTVLGKKFVTKYGAFYSMAVMQITGLILVIPLVPMAYKQFSGALPVEPIGWISLAYLSVGTSVLSYVLWYWALARIETAKLGVWMSLQPVIAAVYSYMAFGFAELSPAFLLGGPIALLGLILAQRSQKRFVVLRPPVAPS